MKLNSTPVIVKVSTTAIALLLMAGINNVALADNTAALKDAIKTDIKVSEAKSTDTKATDAGTKAQVDESFKVLDTNKDGKVSLKEAVRDKALAGQFDAADVNHDGMVSAEEYASYKVALSAPSPAATPTTN
jgi:hypothetical protein